MKMELHVKIQYKGKKARKMNHEAKGDDARKQWQEMLYLDLQTFHIARPESEKIDFIPKSAQARFWWITETQGVLHRSLDKQIRDAMKPHKRALRDEACIKSIELNVISIHKGDKKVGSTHRRSINEDYDEDHSRRPFRQPDQPQNLYTLKEDRVSTYATPMSHSSSSRIPETAGSTAPVARSGSAPPIEIPNGNSWSDRFLFTRMPSDTTDSVSHSTAPVSLTKFDLTLSGLKDLQRTLERRNSDLQSSQTQIGGFSPQSTTSLTGVGFNGAGSTPIPLEVDYNTLKTSFSQHTIVQPSNGIKLDPEVEQQKIDERLTTETDNVRSDSMLSNDVLADDTIWSQSVDNRADTHLVPVDTARNSTARQSNSASFFTAPTRFSLNSLPPDPMDVSTQPVVDLAQQLSDIRRQRVALLGREIEIIDSLKALGKDNEEVASDAALLIQHVVTTQKSLNHKSERLKEIREKLGTLPTSLNAAQQAFLWQEQQDAQQRMTQESQKLQISRERNGVLTSTLRDCQQELKIERERRMALESVLKDLERAPFVVSEVFEAMVKIANISHIVENAELRQPGSVAHTAVVPAVPM